MESLCLEEGKERERLFKVKSKSGCLVITWSLFVFRAVRSSNPAFQNIMSFQGLFFDEEFQAPDTTTTALPETTTTTAAPETETLLPTTESTTVWQQPDSLETYGNETRLVKEVGLAGVNGNEAWAEVGKWMVFSMGGMVADMVVEWLLAKVGTSLIRKEHLGIDSIFTRMALKVLSLFPRWHVLERQIRVKEAARVHLEHDRAHLAEMDRIRLELTDQEARQLFLRANAPSLRLSPPYLYWSRDQYNK